MLGKIHPRYLVIPPYRCGIEIGDPPYSKGFGFRDPPLITAGTLYLAHYIDNS